MTTTTLTTCTSCWQHPREGRVLKYMVTYARADDPNELNSHTVMAGKEVITCIKVGRINYNSCLWDNRTWYDMTKCPRQILSLDSPEGNWYVRSWRHPYAHTCRAYTYILYTHTCMYACIHIHIVYIYKHTQRDRQTDTFIIR